MVPTDKGLDSHLPGEHVDAAPRSSPTLDMRAMTSIDIDEILRPLNTSRYVSCPFLSMLDLPEVVNVECLLKVL